MADNNIDTDEDGNLNNILHVDPLHYPLQAHQDKHVHCKPLHEIEDLVHDRAWDTQELESKHEIVPAVLSVSPQKSTDVSNHDCLSQLPFPQMDSSNKNNCASFHAGLEQEDVNVGLEAALPTPTDVTREPDHHLEDKRMSEVDVERMKQVMSTWDPREHFIPGKDRLNESQAPIDNVQGTSTSSASVQSPLTPHECQTANDARDRQHLSKSSSDQNETQSSRIIDTVNFALHSVLEVLPTEPGHFIQRIATNVRGLRGDEDSRVDLSPSIPASNAELGHAPIFPLERVSGSLPMKLEAVGDLPSDDSVGKVLSVRHSADLVSTIAYDGTKDEELLPLLGDETISNQTQGAMTIFSQGRGPRLRRAVTCSSVASVTQASGKPKIKNSWSGKWWEKIIGWLRSLFATLLRR